MLAAPIIILISSLMVFVVANKKGRNGSLWALLSILVQTILAVVLWRLVQSEATLVVVLLATTAILGFPLLLVVSSLKLPEAGTHARGSSWELDLFGEDREVHRARLELANSSLAIHYSEKSADIPFNFLSASVDGESLIIESSAEDAPLSLAMVNPSLTSREGRIAFSKSLARKLNQARVATSPQLPTARISRDYSSEG